MLDLGAPFEVIDAAVAAEEARDPPFDVYVENWPVVSLFQMLATQWRVVALPMGGVYYQGIDYASVPMPLAALGIKRSERDEVFECLRVMEGAARAVLNAKKSDG